jgi:hypothetical protein
MKSRELLEQLQALTEEQLDKDVLVWDDYACKSRPRKCDRCMGLDVVAEEGEEPEEIIIF